MTLCEDFHKMRGMLYSLEKASDRKPGYLLILRKNFDTMNKLGVLAFYISATREDTEVL